MSGISSIAIVCNSKQFLKEQYEERQAISGIRNGEIAFRNLSTKLKNSIPVAEAAIEANGGLELEHAGETCLKNRILVHAAIQKDPKAIQFADVELRGSISFMALVSEIDYSTIEHATDDLKDDRHFMFSIILERPLALKYASDRLKKDPSLVGTAFRKDNTSLRFAEKEGALPLIRQEGSRLQHLNDRLKDDIDLVRIAFENNAESFQFARRNATLQIVRENGLALRFSPFINDEQIVRAAIEDNPLALQFASERLKLDEDIARLAISRMPQTVVFTHPLLKGDRSFLVRCNDKFVGFAGA